MADFKAKMHQIQNRLGLRPTPRWGSLQRCPRPPSCISGGLLLTGGEGEGRGGEGERGGIAPWTLGGIDAPDARYFVLRTVLLR